VREYRNRDSVWRVIESVCNKSESVGGELFRYAVLGFAFVEACAL
jgi:hypothetical protein